MPHPSWIFVPPPLALNPNFTHVTFPPKHFEIFKILFTPPKDSPKLVPCTQTSLQGENCTLTHLQQPYFLLQSVPIALATIAFRYDEPFSMSQIKEFSHVLCLP